MGCWYILTPLLALPVFKGLAIEAYTLFVEMPYLIALGLLKGIGFWVVVYCGQVMRRTSNSSAGFFGFICIGLMAVGNAIFGEELSMPQWVSVGCLFSLGVYFYFKGHLSTQTSFIKLLFLMQVMVGCMFGMIDHFYLTHSNWFGLIILTGVGMLGTALAFGRSSVKTILKSMTTKKTLKFGLFESLVELTILALFVTYIPVTLGWVAMTLAAVAMMVIASLYWGEGSWKQQLTVGSATYASALPIILT